MPFVTANGVKLFYQQAGTGPDVVLIHAVTSNLAVWVFSGLLDALAADYRVTAFDLRGHGASERPPTGYTSAHVAADFAALHAALDLRPAILVGHSFGGVGAMHAAVETPPRVAGVVLSDSFFPGLRAVEPNFGRLPMWNGVRLAFAGVGADIGEGVDFARLFRAAADLTAGQTAILECVVGPAHRGWLRQLPQLAKTTCGDDVLTEAGLTADRLAAVRQPVAALYDEFSPFTATGEWLERHLPDCVRETVPAAGHLAILENTDGFTAAVRRHVGRMVGC